MFTAIDLLSLYTDLHALGIRVWIDGGWGVDALLGEQTRPHADVDIVVEQKDLPALRAHLEAQGYADVPRDDTAPWNFVLGDSAGRLVDVHAVVFDAQRNGLYGPPERGVMYPADSLTGHGAVLGQPVECIAPQWCSSTPATGCARTISRMSTRCAGALAFLIRRSTPGAAKKVGGNSSGCVSKFGYHTNTVEQFRWVIDNLWRNAILILSIMAV